MYVYIYYFSFFLFLLALFFLIILLKVLISNNALFVCIPSVSHLRQSLSLSHDVKCLLWVLIMH